MGSIGEAMDRGIAQLVESGVSGKTINDEVEAKTIRAALALCGGNQCRAAKHLCWHRNTLSRKINEHGINARHFHGKKPATSSYISRERARLSAIGIACLVFMLALPSLAQERDGAHFATVTTSRVTWRPPQVVQVLTSTPPTHRVTSIYNEGRLLARIVDGQLTLEPEATAEQVILKMADAYRKDMGASLGERDACVARALRIAVVADACLAENRRVAKKAREISCQLNGAPRPHGKAPTGYHWALAGDPEKCFWSALPNRRKKALSTNGALTEATRVDR